MQSITNTAPTLVSRPGRLLIYVATTTLAELGSLHPMDVGSAPPTAEGALTPVAASGVTIRQNHPQVAHRRIVEGFRNMLCRSVVHASMPAEVACLASPYKH